MEQGGFHFDMRLRDIWGLKSLPVANLAHDLLYSHIDSMRFFNPCRKQLDELPQTGMGMRNFE